MNIPTLRTAAGTANYHAFEACFHTMGTSHLQHHVQFYQLPDCTANLPEEFVAHKLIHCKPPQVQDYEGAVADNETVKASHVNHHGLANPSQPCLIHPTGNHKWGECSHF